MKGAGGECEGSAGAPSASGRMAPPAPPQPQHCVEKCEGSTHARTHPRCSSRGLLLLLPPLLLVNRALMFMVIRPLFTRKRGIEPYSVSEFF